MKPKGLLICLTLAVTWAVPLLHADVKTREKVTTKLEGLMGRMAGMFVGSATRNGMTSAVAVKGSRLMRLSEVTGQIIDLDEQKVYTLDPKKKEYCVQTFAELKVQADQARADTEKQVQQMPPGERATGPQQPTSQMTVDVDAKDTGQHKSILGQDAREVVVTATMRQEGHTLDDGGGFVITTDEWLVPTVAALEEVGQFERKYFEAAYGQASSMDPRQMAPLNAMYPAFATLADRAHAEAGRVQGTAVSSTTTFETVMSAEQLQEAVRQQRQQQQQQQQQQQNSGGANIGGAFNNKFGPRPTPVQPRAKVMTATRDVLSIETTVTAADVAIPAGYKEKK